MTRDVWRSLESTPQGDVELARRCRATLRRVFPNPPRTLEDVRVAAEGLLGEPVQVIFGDPGGRALPSALWVRLDSGQSVVWVDRRTSPLHRLVAACHEFGHIYENDTPAPVARLAMQQVASRLADHLASDAKLTNTAITAIVGRCGEPTPAGSEIWRTERAAEMTGRYLAHRLLHRDDGVSHALRWL